MHAIENISVAKRAALPTWFGVGGGAASLAAPSTDEELRVLLAVDPALRVLGEGANLLVDDAGTGVVEGLTIRLNSGDFARTEMNAKTGVVNVGAGVHLFKLINETCRTGLGGLEALAGIPASMGGALAMNAGGAFGQIADVVTRVFAIDREGKHIEVARRDIAFGYRTSGLRNVIITGAELQLTPDDPAKLDARKREIN